MHTKFTNTGHDNRLILLINTCNTKQKLTQPSLCVERYGNDDITSNKNTWCTVRYIGVLAEISGNNNKFNRIQPINRVLMYVCLSVRMLFVRAYVCLCLRN